MVCNDSVIMKGREYSIEQQLNIKLIYSQMSLF